MKKNFTLLAVLMVFAFSASAQNAPTSALWKNNGIQLIFSSETDADFYFDSNTGSGCTTSAPCGFATSAMTTFDNGTSTYHHTTTNFFDVTGNARISSITNESLPAGISQNDPFTGSVTMTYDEGMGAGSQTTTFTFGTDLPVSLISFTAKKATKSIVLQWQTASELNNRHFEIERSQDGRKFETIAIVEGAGNSELVMDYFYIDSEVESGEYYYRLMQVDFDGTTDYSKAVNVKMANAEESSLFPTMLKKGEHLNIKSADDISYQIFSPNMQLVKSDFEKESDTFNTAQLNNGIYSVVFSDGTVKRFIVVE